MYNNAISFTSLGAKIDHSVQGPKGVNIIKISGSLSHRISSLEPTNAAPGFSQIYVVGDNGLGEAKYRLNCALGRSQDEVKKSRMKQGTILMLVHLMGKINPYA
jgi:hypothetical protein